MNVHTPVVIIPQEFMTLVKYYTVEMKVFQYWLIVVPKPILGVFITNACTTPPSTPPSPPLAPSLPFLCTLAPLLLHLPSLSTPPQSSHHYRKLTLWTICAGAAKEKVIFWPLQCIQRNFVRVDEMAARQHTCKWGSTQVILFKLGFQAESVVVDPM